MDDAGIPPHTKPEIVAAIEAARGGSREAVGILYREYSPQVYQYCYHRVSRHPVAEDLTSETFIRVLRSIDRFSWQGTNFSAWVIVIARNLVVDHFRSGAVRREISVPAMSKTDRPIYVSGDETAERPDTDGMRSDLRAAFLQLSDEQRACLVRRFVWEESIIDTARAMGKNESSIKSMQYRAARRLRQDGALERWLND